eukprot:TRINITY_DN30576_c0_g1_i2.p1 TRINITY_DN30576_c0_g1~~TRINITY_DN30576_c0_g1_i2.p1  ORF type:complete len:100 (+),score=20.93 TRINITY_DN30576_c0_g1_i2:60-359(+)
MFSVHSEHLCVTLKYVQSVSTVNICVSHFKHVQSYTEVCSVSVHSEHLCLITLTTNCLISVHTEVCVVHTEVSVVYSEVFVLSTLKSLLSTVKSLCCPH